MARVKDVQINEVKKETQAIYKKFIEDYGPFANQVKVFAHRPIILKYLMGMLLQMAENPILDKKIQEIAIVTVSAINKCDYCIAHHAPNLVSYGLSQETVDKILENDCPGLNKIELLVRDYAALVTRDHNKVSDKFFNKLRNHFSEKQIVELTFRITLCTFFNKFNDVMQIEMENHPFLNHKKVN